MKKWWFAFTIGVLAIALIWTGYWGQLQNKQKQQLIVLQEGNYQRAFYDLLGSMQIVESSLAKVLAAGTPVFERSQLNLAWQHAHLAQRDLAQLPLTRNVLVQTQKFLNQLGDYCFVLSNGNRQEIMSNVDRQQIIKLHNQSTSLTEQLQALQLDMGEQRYPWIRIATNKHRDWSVATRELPEEVFDRLEDQLQTFPQLIYDGPFSEQVINREISLTGKEISREEAMQISMEFLHIKEQGIGTIMRIVESDDEATLPVYTVRVIPQEGPIGDQVVLDITKVGGHVVWMLKNRGTGTTVLSLMDAQEAAEEFIQKIGFKSFMPTGVVRSFDQAVVSFAEIQEEMVVYPHLLKAKVALDTGEIIGYEGINYILSKKDRKWPEGALSESAAREKLNTNLNVEMIRKAVIPLANGNEAFCWEFKGQIGEMVFLVYIDAITGEERDILKYIDTVNGILTM